MNRVFLYFIAVFFSTLFLSCGLSGPKPDKHIVATIQLEGNLSEEEVNDAVLAIENRFAKWGAYPEIEKTTSKQTLEFSLKTYADQERVITLLSAQANLEFFEVIQPESLMPFISAANNLVGKGEALDEIDDLLGSEESDENLEADNPLLSKLQPGNEYAGLFAVLEADTALVRSYLTRSDVLNLLPGNENKTTKFLWSLKSNREGAFTLFAVRTLKSAKAPIDGSHISEAVQSYSGSDMPTVTMRMDKEGALIWERMTEKAYQNQSHIAIVVDNIVYSTPGVAAGPIRGGRTEIAGDFTVEEAIDLASMISAGAIPKTKVVQFDVTPLE